jgi:hypothetical protein
MLTAMFFSDASISGQHARASPNIKLNCDSPILIFISFYIIKEFDTHACDIPPMVLKLPKG